MSDVLSHTNECLIVGLGCILILLSIYVLILHNNNRILQKEMQHIQFVHQSVEDYKRYCQMIRKHDDEQRILVHDMKFHFQVIAALADNNSSVAEYIAKIIELPVLNETIDVSMSNIINLVLNRYIQLCKKECIELDTDMQRGNLDFMSDEAVVALLSNLLDNALEAVQRLKNNSQVLGNTLRIYIKLVCNRQKNITVLTITNPSIEPLGITIGGIMKTSKVEESVHGYGLKSINKIVNEYDGIIKQSYNKEKQIFSTIIVFGGRKDR